MFVYAASGVRALMPDATLAASYHAYNWCRIGRLDKAFTPHPANTRHILPVLRILLKAHSFFHHCHHSVIFPVETNVTEMALYG